MPSTPDYTVQILFTKPNIRAEAFFPADFIGFDGHFPASPLLPGFMHIQLALDVLRTIGAPCELREVIAAKFTRPILPDTRIMLILTPNLDPNTYEGTVSAGDESCSTFTLRVE